MSFYQIILLAFFINQGNIKFVETWPVSLGTPCMGLIMGKVWSEQLIV